MLTLKVPPPAETTRPQEAFWNIGLSTPGIRRFYIQRISVFWCILHENRQNIPLEKLEAEI